MSRKKKRSNTEAIVEDLVCPILLRLPPDPVVAPDGYIYDRDAIQRHLETAERNEDGTVNSPMNRTPLKQDCPLIRVPLYAQHIDKLVDGNLVPLDYANSWQRDKAILACLRKAEHGTGDAQYDIGNNYWRGEGRFEQDAEKAYEWFMKSHKNGCVLGTAAAGTCLLRGEGVAQNIPMGVSMLAMASSQGSDFAALELGSAHAGEDYGIMDKDSARFYLKMAVATDCKYPQMDRLSKAHAEQLLESIATIDLTT